MGTKKTNTKSAVLVANYILAKGGPIDALKLQKTLYFIEAIHLARYGKSLITEDFEAWKRGPVLSCVYKKFKEQSTFYSKINFLSEEMDFESLFLPEEKELIDLIIEDCAKKEASELMLDSHDPVWTQRRVGLGPNDNSTRKLDKRLIRDYYRSQLANSNNPVFVKLNTDLQNSIQEKLFNRFNETWTELAK